MMGERRLLLQRDDKVKVVGTRLPLIGIVQ